MPRPLVLRVGSGLLILGTLGMMIAPSGGEGRGSSGARQVQREARHRGGVLEQGVRLRRGMRGSLSGFDPGRCGNLRLRGGSEGGGEGEVGEESSGEIELVREGEGEGELQVALEEESDPEGEEKAEEALGVGGDEEEPGGGGAEEGGETSALFPISGDGRLSLLDEADAGMLYDDPLDDPELDPAVQYFLTRCTKGRADKGTYAGSCRFFLTHLVEAAADGQVNMVALRKVFAAIEEAGLWVEMGMFNCIMAMVAARVRHGDGTSKDAQQVMDWFRRANESNPQLYAATLTIGGNQPLRRDGWDSAYGIEIWTNFSEMNTSLRNYDFSEMTDTGGNTLRSLYESMLCTCVGSAEHKTASLQDAYRIVDSMEQQGMPPDVDTYTMLLLVVSEAAKQGEATMADAARVLKNMRNHGMEPHCMTYGAWLAVVSGCASWNGSATVVEGEAIIEIMFRLGIRPDIICWGHILHTVAHQARLGVPTRVGPGVSRYDPVQDAERVIAMMQRVEPRMWPDDTAILHYLSAVLHATKNGCAGVAEAWGCYRHFNSVLDSLTKDRLGGVQRVEHWLGGTKEVISGPDCELFNSMLRVAEAGMRRHNASLDDAVGVLREMEVQGVVGDSETRELFASIEAMGKERGEGEAGDEVKKQVASMLNITWQHRDLREVRQTFRKPKIWWKEDVDWQEPPPTWGNDPWNGLKQ